MKMAKLLRLQVCQFTLINIATQTAVIVYSNGTEMWPVLTDTPALNCKITTYLQSPELQISSVFA